MYVRILKYISNKYLIATRLQVVMSQEKVHLNVGGTQYTTTISTLTRETNSMLGRMFSAKWQSGEVQSEPYFIDADGTHFRYVLNYLRRGESVFLPNNPDLLDELLVEANYFHLDGLVHLITDKLNVLRPGVPHNVVAPAGPFDPWVPVVGESVKWRPDAIEGYWRSVSVAVASFHYQGHQDAEAVCGFMHKTKFLPDDMEVFFLRCVSCRASTRVGEVWRYDLDSLKSIKAVMPTLTMRIVAAPASINHIVSSDCVSVNWSSTMILHVSKSALMPV